MDFLITGGADFCAFRMLSQTVEAFLPDLMDTKSFV